MVLYKFKGIEFSPGLNGAILNTTGHQPSLFFTRASWLSNNKLRYWKKLNKTRTRATVMRNNDTQKTNVMIYLPRKKYSPNDNCGLSGSSCQQWKNFYAFMYSKVRIIWLGTENSSETGSWFIDAFALSIRRTVHLTKAETVLLPPMLSITEWELS